MMLLTLLLISLHSANTQAESDAVIARISACQQALSACATGNCQPERVTKLCPVEALRQRELRILQTELRSAVKRLEDLPEPTRNLCAEKANTVFSNTVAQLNATWDSHKSPLSIPRARLHGEDLETVYRARLDLFLTGRAMKIRTQGADDAKMARFKSCPQGPLLPVVLLRTQNLAYAHKHKFIDRLKAGTFNKQILFAPYIIFLHADLWHPAQEEASRVFDALQEKGDFPAVPARNFHIRVAAHKPLYKDNQLAAGWPAGGKAGGKGR